MNYQQTVKPTYVMFVRGGNEKCSIQVVFSGPSNI